MINTHLSKFLSLVLRHQPEAIGIELDSAGWTDVSTLLRQLNAHGHAVDEAKLRVIVAENNKQRFALSPDGQRIRANQGHSVPVDLGLEPLVPPTVLYHGTTERNLNAILASGLHKQSRHAVHLSADVPTARLVGQRHGKPVILCVDAAGLHAAGGVFYQSANGVWLIEHVPPAFLTLAP